MEDEAVEQVEIVINIKGYIEHQQEKLKNKNVTKIRLFQPL